MTDWTEIIARYQDAARRWPDLDPRLMVGPRLAAALVERGYPEDQLIVHSPIQRYIDHAMEQAMRDADDRFADALCGDVEGWRPTGVLSMTLEPPDFDRDETRIRVRMLPDWASSARG